MGGKSSKKVYTDLTNAGVSPELATKLAKGAKLKGAAAKNFLKVSFLNFVVSYINWHISSFTL